VFEHIYFPKKAGQVLGSSAKVFIYQAALILSDSDLKFFWRKQMKRFSIAFLLFIFALVVVHAQTTTGRLVGTVTEANGAVIPGATVVVIDSQTGKERTATSNAEGGFTVPLLDVGTYTVKVTSKGFKSTTTSITIQIGQEYSLGVQLQSAMLVKTSP